MIVGKAYAWANAIYMHKVAIIYGVKMSVIVGQIIYKGGIVILNLVTRLVFV